MALTVPAWDTIAPNAPSCYSCGAFDPPPPWFTYCGECGHVWKTEADLIAHDFRVHIALDPAAEPRKVEDIHTCPCCAHDL